MKTREAGMERTPGARRTFRKSALTLALATAFVGIAGPAQAQTPAQVPLFLTSPVDPNVLFLIDDSGSMQWETMPDELTTRFGSGINSNYVMWTFPRVANLHGGSSQYSNRRTVRFSSTDMAAMYRSSDFNTVYYDPSVTYEPWSLPDGSRMPDADPASAPNRPLFSDYGERDLTSWNQQWARWLNDNGGHSSGTKWFWPAAYYYYTGGPEDDRSSYEFVQIHSGNDTYSGHGRESRVDCDGGVCTYEQEIQNFANWYSYHRNRIFASRAGIGAAFADQGEEFRVGYGSINRGVLSGVRPFAGSDREEFFEELYEQDVPAAGTPLRTALQAAGTYFGRDDDRGPWSETPGEWGDPRGAHLECRQSYTILMSDGYWNGTTSPGVGNADDTQGTEHHRSDGQETYQYIPSAPFRDGHSNTLADVAMEYWKNDLRDDLENAVPTDARNPAFWQHMVTYTVGLGVEGEVDPQEAFAAIATGEEIDWPDPHSSDSAKIDDMLHAAVNSRGDFFSAQEPGAFANELSGVLQDISDRSGASRTSLATESTQVSVDEGARVFQAHFNSADWSGDLVALEADFETLEFVEAWSAADLLDARVEANGFGDRSVFTFDRDSGEAVSFEWGEIPDADQIFGDEEDGLVDYLAGDDSNEIANGGPYRNRGSVMGDIVNSDPTYQGPNLNMGYSNLTGYSGFLEDNEDRAEVVYVGSNAGMLHAFDAETGDELFAYAPSMLLEHLPDLADPDYQHRYYVDGSQHITHAQVDGEWKTILIGTLGAGGKGLYALDVTDPETFGQNPDEDVFWEFTADDSEHLGYTIDGEPTVARTGPDEWSVLFGNGYDSDSGDAVLMILDLEHGTVRKEIETESDGDNGLSPVVFRAGSGNILEAGFAGDLKGNMWAFDVDPGQQDPSADDWDVTFIGQGNAPVPLFEADRPITAKPAVGSFPEGGSIVLFGTGQYFAEGDNEVSGETEAFYGIRIHEDTDAPVDADDDLLTQEIEGYGMTGDGIRWRVTSEETLDPDEHEGWKLALDAADAEGERVVTQPVLIDGRVEFVTLIPFDDPCRGGGTSFLFALDAASGGRPDDPVFDIGGSSGSFGEEDLVEHDGEEIPPSAVDPGVGIAGRPTVVRDPETGQVFRLISGTEDEKIDEAPGAAGLGPRSWIQLR
ncbi:pilus assembly protein [Thioalkalivibrio sp. ALE20]|uniref:pilus assembly protein n=1 Tax=Thioalkalivibrio sp. ALE20 TaxID=545275 RepID=UPI001E603AC8|nr:PilC/PilY family type IV pilus protein [Thioalkalivibrio sp. ALE20]